MSKNKIFTIELIFDDKDSTHGFIAHWLDGGGDGGGNLDWDTVSKESNWNPKSSKWHLRIKGTGYPIDENGDVIKDD